MWTYYRVSFLFLTKLCASVPSTQNLVKDWVESRQPKVRPAGGRTITEIQEEVMTTLLDAEEVEVASKLVFQRVGGLVVMRAGTIRAHMKDCARVLSSLYIGKMEGEKAFSTKIINGCYPDERQYWIPILRPEGTEIREHDDTFDKAVHMRNPRTGAPMNCLKTFEFIEPARMDFTLKVLGQAKGKAKPAVALEDLKTLFTYGGVHGYAGERGDGEGKYMFTIEEIPDAE